MPGWWTLTSVVCLLCSLGTASCHGSSDDYEEDYREKRSASHLLEVYGIMEYEVYKRWTEIGGPIDRIGHVTFIRELYRFHGAAINRRFGTLSVGAFDIQTGWKGLYIADTPSKSTWLRTVYNSSLSSGPLVDTLSSSYDLASWLRNQSQSSGIPQADRYIAIVPYDLETPNDNPLELCTPYAISFVTETFFDNIIEAAMTRELARSLGAHYDGVSPSRCPDENFIMSPHYSTVYSPENLWAFSSCAEYDIRYHLNNSADPCLFDGSPSPGPNFNMSALPGQLYGGDRQCQVLTNWTGSVVCREYYNMTYVDVCLGLWCLESSNNCTSFIPAEGTSCSFTEACLDDLCVPLEVGPPNKPASDYPDWCVFGDVPKIVSPYGNCSATVQNSRGYCVNPDFELACCVSCPEQRDYNNPGCPYGDGVDCASLEAHECYSKDRRDECCNTCDGFRSRTPGCEFGDKQYCGDIARHECYDNSTSSTCCQTCPGLRNGPPGCVYGDHDTDCASIYGQDCYDNSTRERCCLTCPLYKTSIRGCEYGDRDRDACVTLPPNLCYTPSERYTCCQRCSNFHTGNDSCPYGDRIRDCNRSQCSSYTLSRREECCQTCYNVTKPMTTSLPPPTTSATASTLQTTPAANNTQKQGNNLVVPLAAGLGGAVFVLIVVIVVIFICIRRRRSGQPSFVREQMYNEYKEYKLRSRMNDRPPMPAPRNSTSELPRPLVRQDTGTYAYINPADVATSPESEQMDKGSGAPKRDGNDPLPPTPGQYVDFKPLDKYGYVEPVSKTNGIKRGNTYVQSEQIPTNRTKIQIGGSPGEAASSEPRVEYTNSNSPYNQLQPGRDEHAYSGSGDAQVHL